MAFVRETRDCLAVRWQPGTHTRPRELVRRLRRADVCNITVRLHKGRSSREMGDALDELGVFVLLKVPRYAWLEELSERRHGATQGADIFPDGGEDL